MWPILLPGVVNPSALQGNLLVDPNLRYKQSRESALTLISSGIFEKLVIVDGSSTSILTTHEIAVFASQGISVEQLSFQQDASLVSQFGKSLGEVMLIDYAFNNSSLIRNSPGFYKLTSRYVLHNIKHLIAQTKSLSNLFYDFNPWPISRLRPFTCTAFYKCTNLLYKNHLSSAKDILTCPTLASEGQLTLESAYHRLLNSLTSRTHSLPFPYFEGYAGSTGAEYNNRYYNLRNMAALAGILAKSYES